LYACTCEFSLHQESFDVILVNTVISRWGCYTWYQSHIEVKCILMSLKMTNHVAVRIALAHIRTIIALR
jgi:hypothetical protein